MKKIFNTLLGLALLLLIGWAFLKILQIVWDNISTLDTTLSATIITASVTFIVAFTTVLLGKYYERKLLIEKELREKKIPIYNEFIVFFIDLLSNKKKYSDEELADYFVKFTKELIIWGSDDVIRKWSSFRVKLVDKKDENKFSEKEDIRKWMIEFEDLLVSIRKDTGTKSSRLKQGDILNMFINDL